MKTRSFLVAALGAAFASRILAADAAPVVAASKINAVVVYADRAVVTRAAELNLAPGLREIVFERLPASLVDQSLQVSGAGSAEAAIVDVTASQTFVEVTPNERIKALEDEAAGVAKQIRVLNDRATILSDQREFVKRLLTASTTAFPLPGGNGAVARPPLEEWQRIYDYADVTLGKIAAEALAIDGQKETLTARKTALDQQLAQMRGGGRRAFKTVVVRVSAARSGNLRLEVAYSVPNASWTPAYDARVRSAQREVELSYFGVIRQNTGEDWENVALTLSTARPSVGGGPPALPAWIVDVGGKVNPEFIRALGITNLNEAAAWATSQSFLATDNGGMTQRFTANDNAGSVSRGSNQPEAAFVQAGVATATTSATFKIAAPTSLPSNNTAQRVAITTLKLESALRYESTPRMREAAFLAAPSVNTSDYPLLGGQLNTFLDSTYVATSWLNPAMPGEQFELALGVDEGIGIKRRLVSRFAEDTGLGGKGRRVTYEIIVSVTNLKNSIEHVRFREAVPVSRDEKIVVRLLAPLERDIGTPDRIKDIVRELDGKLTWRLTLKPGEKREVTLKFSVEHPADLVVAGLE